MASPVNATAAKSGSPIPDLIEILPIRVIAFGSDVPPQRWLDDVSTRVQVEPAVKVYAAAVSTLLPLSPDREFG
jgi:hypothetical protein